MKTKKEETETAEDIPIPTKTERDDISFRDLVTVFFGAEIITAAIIWLTILIERGLV